MLELVNLLKGKCIRGLGLRKQNFDECISSESNVSSTLLLEELKEYIFTFPIVIEKYSLSINYTKRKHTKFLILRCVFPNFNIPNKSSHNIKGTLGLEINMMTKPNLLFRMKL